MKFAHIGDCHLGGWRQPELKELNFKSFQKAMEICTKEKVEFILLTGDLFDVAYPPIDTLKDTFHEFKRLKDNNIPVFLIAGSHDYSVAGKSFLDVLEKAGFCQNIARFEERENKIMLHPTVYKEAAIYGYPGKKSSLEIEELENMFIQDAPGLYKILMLHTTMRDAIGSLPIKSIDPSKLPEVDYVALSHLHIKYNKDNRVYSGPLFPNNIAELEELQGGIFYIVENNKVTRQHLKLKEIIVIEQKISNALTATDTILKKLNEHELKDKIVILKLSGILEQGKTSDIDFTEIEKLTNQKQAFTLLKSTTKLYMSESDTKTEVLDTANLEEYMLDEFIENNPHKFNTLIQSLFRALQIEKQDDEKAAVYEDRLMTEVSKII